MSPKELVHEWVRIFNEGNADILAEMYTDNAINHQVANDPVVGKAAIREMFKNEFARAEMVCIPEQILQDGEWAILEWKDSLGFRGCGFFHVQHDKILFQRGYWDTLSFLKVHGLPFPR